MPELATIRFRAKRMDDVTRWTPRAGGGSDFSEGHTAYRVPVLTSSHVATPRTQQGMQHALMFNGRPSADIAKTRTQTLLKAHGLDTFYVYADDAGTHPDIVSIEPDKGGFMATITLRLDLCRKPAA